jgi:histidine triad (HIT) family protein
MPADSNSDQKCPFCAILSGEEPGVILDRNDELQFALIKSIHPEASVHLLAIPTQHVGSTEALEAENREMFLQLVDYAISQGHALVDDFPKLQQGFTLKMHFGSYESVPHAKLHILGME